MDRGMLLRSALHAPALVRPSCVLSHLLASHLTGPLREVSVEGEPNGPRPLQPRGASSQRRDLRQLAVWLLLLVRVGDYIGGGGGNVVPPASKYNSGNWLCGYYCS